MSATASNGSPTIRRTAINRASSSQENAPMNPCTNPPVTEDKTGRQDGNLLKKAAALSSSKFGNQAPKKMKVNHDASTSSDANPMDTLLAKLGEQQNVLDKQQTNLEKHKVDEDVSAFAKSRTAEYVATTSAPSGSHKDEDFELAAGVTTRPGTSLGDLEITPSTEEVLRLKKELEETKAKVARMDQELIQSRITKHTVEQVIGASSEADFALSQPSDIPARRIGPAQQTINASLRPTFGRDSSWGQEDTRSDGSEAMSAGDFNRNRAIWTKPGNQQQYGVFQAGMQGVIQDFQDPTASFNAGPWLGQGGAYSQQYGDGSFVQAMGNYRGNRYMGGMQPELGMTPAGDRRGNIRSNRFGNRNVSSFPYDGSNSSYDGLTPVSGYGSASALSSGMPAVMGAHMGMGYQPQPIGTPSGLSPFAPEFTSGGSSWKNDVIATEGPTFLPTTEPLNYRRLLDRTVNCNWKYIVDKIVCNNDQQASIFLQQKLKVGTTEQKYDIVEAIVDQAYPLMVNRFGNFLVQRCFEHGTPEQVIKIAEAIRGNTLNLSMDAFGCHVVQKAFDSVPEDYKAIMVHELLRRIPETVIHRYACHVWQKLFELRWAESPPQIMKFVNDALHGMWHEVALGETGSLVVQNIFENCLEEDKRPCIEEVLASIDIVAHGQFGNWCIQHICEHGAPADRSRAVDHVIRYASEYSMDQFASKVVEKCLKIGGVDFLTRYLDRVCEGRLDRPRIPLIDIASDQYGNYLIQYILTHSNPQHREVVAAHIRKHMVSLRGSKFGSRVGMLCTNPAIATRPGPGVGPGVGPAIGSRLPPTPRYGGAYR